jgi:hypothetical protein
MKIIDYKLHYLSSQTQVMHFDKEGYVVESCQSLVSGQLLNQGNVYPTFPLYKTYTNLYICCLFPAS